MAGDNTVFTIIKNYFGVTVIGTLFVFALIYCLIRKDKLQKNFLVGILLMIFLIFNDISRRILEFFGEKKTFYRFIWMIPVVLIIAYAATDILSLLKRKMSKTIFVVGIFVVLLLNMEGTYVVRSFALPENKYSISDDVLQISTIIEEDCGIIEGTLEEQLLKKKTAVPMELELQLRSYDASITYGVSRTAYIYVMENGLYTDKKKYNTQETVMRAVHFGLQEDAEELRTAIDKLEINYLVVSTGYYMESYFAAIGCNIIGYSNNYAIYKVTI